MCDTSVNPVPETVSQVHCKDTFRCTPPFRGNLHGAGGLHETLTKWPQSPSITKKHPCQWHTPPHQAEQSYTQAPPAATACRGLTQPVCTTVLVLHHGEKRMFQHRTHFPSRTELYHQVCCCQLPDPGQTCLPHGFAPIARQEHWPTW